MSKFSFVSVIILAGAIAHPSAAQFTVLHQFTGGSNDGSGPRGTPVVSGGIVYGTTVNGGDADSGTVFRIGSNGTNLQLLHEFNGTDGRYPMSAPLLVGSTIYGTTLQGAVGDRGSIFRLDTAGSGFATLHTYSSSSGGASPQTEPVISGSVLYGTTRFGGTADHGTTYKMNPDGTGYTLLHSFAGSPSDGVQPNELRVNGSTIYASTVGGGTGQGTVFRHNTDGTGYQVLHNFATGGSDGSFLQDSPVLIGSMLYGATAGGGANGYGTIFKMNTDGSGFAVLHDFTATGNILGGGATRLVASGSTLYGLSSNLGAFDQGMIFKMQIDGSAFQVLHDFSGIEGSGESNMTIDGSTLYGVMRYGGQYGGGTLFSMTVPEPGALSLAVAGSIMSGMLVFWRRRARGPYHRGRFLDRVPC